MSGGEEESRAVRASAGGSVAKAPKGDVGLKERGREKRFQITY